MTRTSLTGPTLLPSLVLSLMILGGCGSSDTEPIAEPVVEPAADEAGDLRGAPFAAEDGKADGFQISEGSIAAVLGVANTATLKTLDDPVAEGGVGLNLNAAEGIVAKRPFATLDELDAVDYVGPVSLNRLYTYAITAGMVEATFACQYEDSWYFDSAARMGDFVVETQKLSPASSLTRLQEGQLLGAATHLGFLTDGDGLDAVWDASDDGAFELRRMDFGDQADWIHFYAGDTQVGVVFEADTTKIVAEVSDGDILACRAHVVEPTTPDDPSAPPVEPATCAYDTSWYFDNSGEMADYASEKIVVDERSTLTELQQAQLWATALHLEFVSVDDDPSKIWGASDDGEFEFRRVDMGDQFDWVRFYAGDTQVGVVFQVDTTIIVAEVSDGDILGCGAPRAQDPSELTCSYTHDWEFESANDMQDAATDLVELTADVELTALQQEQLWLAVTFIESVGADEDFSKVWGASDDGTFELFTVEGEDGVYDWIRFYAGDTQVGVVFEVQSSTIVAQVSDGDVLFCR